MTIEVRKSVRRLTLLMITFVFPLMGMAQTGRIEGKVTQQAFDEPLIGVNVTLKGTRIGTASGPDGSFILNQVPVGDYTLEGSMVGYEPARIVVTVKEGETSTVHIDLIERPIEISEIVVERVMMTGGLSGLARIPGSAHYISPQELEKFSYNDVHRALRFVPGVVVQEEDGYGLRPNIGMRGTGTERSSKITIMEDGVLMAPAPYAAPAAYYFPTVGRMQGIEVRKGSSQIKYGPYTTGGALNFISTQIPANFSGRAEVFGGTNETRTIHLYAGDSYEHVGFLVESYQTQTDGFKNLDGGGSTGFDIKDYLAKISFHTSDNARLYQALALKVGYTDEQSNETYLGLTDADFRADPYRRYAASQRDLMDTEHRLYQVRHVIRPAKHFDLTTTLYRTEFARNWFKLDRVLADGDRVGIADLLDNPEAYPGAISLIHGTEIEGGTLEVKANNREYYARGAETIAGVQLTTGSLKHELELGIRYHEDQEDRFQWVDLFRMDDGVMEYQEAGIPGTESNRIDRATAFASFAQYRLTRERWGITPGLRFEHIEIERQDYGKTDTERAGTNLAKRSNTVDVFIPGIGVDYELRAGVTAFAGVHKGFAPPGSTEGARPEESISYELGTRLHRGVTRAQAVAFFNDYNNLLGADLAAGGGTGTGNLFNGGEVDVVGLELSLAQNLGTISGWRFSIPLQLSYTYTDAEFQSSFESEFEGWGTVEKGDELPYLPRHQFAVGLGLENADFSLNLGGKYVSRMRTEADRGGFVKSKSTDAHLVMDLAASYTIFRQAKLFAAARNVTDEVYVVSRRPAGLRPGLPRTLLIGIKTNF